MLRIGAVIIVSLMLIGNVSLAASASYVNGVAVYKDKPYLIRVYATVESGNGTVNILGAKGDQLFYESIKEACYMAAWMNGIDPWSLNYNITIDLGRLNTTYLAGTSLSLAVYIATIAAITNLPINNDFLVTGMINPDGTIGFVSDVDIKGKLADRLKIPYYIYPILQDDAYDVREKPTHIGAFAFTSKAIVVERDILRNITSSKIPVSNVLDIENLILPTPVKVSSGNLSWPKYHITSKDSHKIINFIYNRTKYYLDIVNKTYTLSREEQISELLDIVGEGIYYTTSLLNRFNESEKLTWDSAVALLEAYKIASELYFSILLYQGKIADVTAEYRLAQSIARQVLADLEIGVPAMGLPYAIEGSYMFWSGAREYNRTLPLTLAYVNSIGRSPALVTRVASGFAEASMLMYRSAILVAESITCAGPVLQAGRVKDLTSKFIKYGEHLRTYASRYAGVSQVRSDMIFLANGHLWIATQLFKKENTNIVNYLTVLGHTVRAVTLYSTYFALHPGFVDVVKFRYNASREIVNYLVESIGGADFMDYFNVTITSYALEDKLYLNQLYITYMKLIVSSLGEITTELSSMNMNSSQSETMGEAKGYLSEHLSSYAAVGVLLSILLAGIIYIIRHVKVLDKFRYE